MNSTTPARFAAGDFDMQFGEGGSVLLTEDTGLAIRTPFVHVMPTGHLLVAAKTTINEHDIASFVLFKYSPDGQTAKDFGDGRGYVMGSYPFMEFSAGQALSLQLAGGQQEILMLGYASNLKHDHLDRLMISRFHADGSLDHSFGGTGHVELFPFSHIWTSYSPNTGSLAQTQDRIYVSATFYSTDFPEQQRALVFCLKLDGSLDLAFNETGCLEIGMNGFPTTLCGVAIQPSGNIVVAGSMRTPAGLHGLFARILPDGQLDPSFGNAGNGLTLFRAIGLDSALNSFLIDDEQRLVGMGYSLEPSLASTLAMVCRITLDGLPDLSFNHGNPVLTTLAGSNLGWQTGIVDTWGQVITLGSHSVPDSLNWQVLMARYLADGTLDGAFGSDGFVAHAMDATAPLLAARQLATNRLVAAMDQPGILGQRAMLFGFHTTTG